MANTLRFKRGLVSTIPTALAGEPLFTTDTFDLYIGNGTTNTRFQKYIASGTTSQLLRGDGSLLTMPIVLTSPSNGQVLKYDGTNWVNSADAGVTGSGTTNYLPKFASSTTLNNSSAYDSGAGITVERAGDVTLGVTATAPGSTSIYLTPNGGGFGQLSTLGSTHLRLGTNGTERARFTAGGNFLLGSTTDNGLRFQVTGDGYFSGSVGIGTSSLTSYGLRVNKTIVGALSSTGIYQDGTVQSTVTSNVFGIYNSARTQAVAFTLTNYYHYYADQFALGAGSSITNQYGYVADSTLTGATNNYGFFGNIAAATGRWNLYMNGTANNYLNGSLGIGTQTLTGFNLRIGKNIEGAATSYGAAVVSTVQSTVTNGRVFYSEVGTQAATFTLNELQHFFAVQGVFGAGSTVTNQYGFRVLNNMTGATNNYGFYGDIASGTGRWNLYMNGTAANYLNGSLGLGVTAPNNRLSVSVPFAATNDTGVILSAQTGVTSVASISTLVENVSTGATAMLFSTLTANGSLTEKMRLTNGGNLGLGVVPSASWFTGSRVIQIGATAALWNNGSNNSAFSHNAIFGDASTTYIQTGLASYYRQLGGQHQWFTAPSGTAGNPITFTQAMTLDASGNLLVGSTSAGGSATPVNISLGSAFGTNTAGSTANLKLRLYDDGVNTNHYGFGVSSNLMEVSFPSSIAFFNGASASRTERMRINASGRVLIGSSSDSGETFQLTGTMRVSGASTFGGNLNLPNTGESYLQNAASTTFIGLNFDTPYIRFAVGGTVRAFMNATGLGLGTGSPSARLDVVGVSGTTIIRATSADTNGNADVEIRSTGTLGSSRLYFGDTAALSGSIIYNHSLDAMLFGANGTTDRMRLTTGGNLHIGPFTSDSGDRLQVVGNLRVSSASILLGNVTFGTQSLGAGMYWDNTNNRLGIGMSVPATQLHVRNAAGAIVTIESTNAGSLATPVETSINFNGHASNLQAQISIQDRQANQVGGWLYFRLKDASNVLQDRLIIDRTGAATFSSTAQAAGFITSGGTGYAVINSAATTVTALRPTGGGASIMSTNSNGLHIAVGTQAAGDLILASNNTERIRLSSNGFFSQLNATNPSASITDSYIQYSADVVAGNAAPHFRTENGAVIKLYQETTGVGNSIISLGGGNAVLDDTTFDGYTLRQIVKALRNQGILA